MNRLRVLFSVVRDPSLLRIEVAYLGFSVAENGTWVAILVYAYSRGGAVAAGLVATIQLIPSAIIAPVAAYAGDRFRRDRVLVAGYLAQAAAMGATAGTLFADAPVWIVYTAATAAAVAVRVTRPAQNALLPSVTTTVEHLTAANATSGVVEGAGIFAGPFHAGVILEDHDAGRQDEHDQSHGCRAPPGHRLSSQQRAPAEASPTWRGARSSSGSPPTWFWPGCSARSKGSR